jgi:dolichyl-phosphate beta-glucosyltransferase
MDVWTHAAGDTSPAVAEPVGAPTATETAPRSFGPLLRGVRTVAFHLVALACFTVPAVVLWWHVWSGHPSSALTCGCGDPAQEVWFIAWPAWAVGHLDNVFYSGAVNVPHGANLLSNTSGPLIGLVLAPVTWAFGPIAATNVALTLAPALSAWACFAAIRPLVTWKTGAVPAALVFGYSSAIVTSLTFGHASVSVLVIPPFLFTTLHEIVIRQEHSVRRDGLLLAALLVA